MRAIRILLFVIAGLAVVVLLLGLFSKRSYHIERSIMIDAPRSLVVEQVRYLRNFAKWSPWNGLDPDMQVSFGGVDGQAGGYYSWVGNEDVGSGRMLIKSADDRRVDLEIRFDSPWKSVAPSFFQIDSVDGKVLVRWGFDMHIGFPWNGLAALTDVNTGVGKDFERGLSNLLKVCDGILHPRYRGYVIEDEETDSVRYFIGHRRIFAPEFRSDFFVRQFPLLFGAVDRGKVSVVGSPCTLAYGMPDSSGVSEVAAALPVSRFVEVDTFSGLTISGGRRLRLQFFGNFDSISVAHGAMEDYMKLKRLTMIPPFIEEYITTVSTEPDTSKWLTVLTYYVQDLSKIEKKR
jgi:hypothetical protein